MSDDGFNQLKEETEEYYGSIDHIKCSALNNASIHFTSEGLNHLKYSKKKPRTKEVQANKFKLLKKGVALLEKTTTIQEYSERTELVVKKKHKKLVKEWLPVGYWGFIGIIGGTRVKVVVKRVDNSKYMFWSVIPTWQTKEIQGHRITDRSNGDLAQD